jgi:2-oxoglutarate ferredoxin oxidoreductase subunit beta
VGRRNIDITIIIHNNQVYGLTKGQASPTLPRGIKTKALPMPNMQDPINPVRLALASGYTFIARGYAYNVQHLKEVIKRAIQHKGLSVVEVLQPCPTYNDVYTKEVYAQKIVYLEKEFPDWDPVVKSPEDVEGKIKRAWDLSETSGDKIYVGVFYQNPHVPTYEERIANRIPGYLKIPPAKVPIHINGKPIASVEHILKPRMV